MENNLDALDLQTIISNFHFIRPWWLLGIFALLIILLLLKKIRYYQSPWQHFLPSHLAKTLLESSQGNATQVQSTQGFHWLKPFIIGCCTILALAGPAWQKLPQPVYQLDRGAVIIMDMSYSMLATDVKPNRLTRARYKAIDLLDLINEGDIGLIAYAGDAFIISPLTQDDNNIALLLPSLSPDIMPVAGANALAALTLADSTLKNAGHISGDIYWFTDDLDNDEMSDVFEWSANNNHKVNILGVGSKAGGPIKLSNGQLLKDNRGAIVVPKLPESRLASFARGSRGVYRTMTNNNSDIEALTAHLSAEYNDAKNSSMADEAKKKESEQAMQGDQYQEQGPWLLLIILPLLLTYFRRGTSILAITWLMPLAFTLSLTSISPNSYAASGPSDTPNEALTNTDVETSSNGVGQFWQDLWQTSDQQGQQHYQQQEYQQAAKQFEDSQWQGSAHYKAGDYEKALESFQQSDTAKSLYNQGNALAKLKKVDEAIAAYQQALQKDPDLTDAKENLALLEAMKKQQEQQKQEQKNKDGQDSQDGDQQKSDQKQDGQQNDGDKNEGEQSESEQNNSQQQSQDQQQSQNEQQQGEEQDSDEKNQHAQDKNEQEKTEEQLKQEAAQQAKDDEQQQESGEKSLAQQALDSKEKETNQKHQQLLNKVTDDPYLLLRNKMSLEYQKRKNDGSQQGVTKKW